MDSDLPKKTCFVSYSRGNIDAKFQQFIADLSLEVRTVGGPQFDDCLFRDMEDTALGENWRDSIAEALRFGDVLLCIYSPHFFCSPWCGKEVQVFLDRVALAVGDPPDVILPVIWSPVPVEMIPQRLRSINWNPDLPQVYAGQGLFRLVNRSRYDDEYHTVVSGIADAIVSAAKLGLPPLERRPVLDETPSAFAVDLGNAASRPPGGPDQVHLLCLAGTRDEMTEVTQRQTLRGYSDQSDKWRPFGQLSVNMLVSRAACECALNFYTVVERDAESLRRQLEDAVDLNTIVMVVLDPWCLYLDGYRAVASVVDRTELLSGHGIAVLASDEETRQQTAVLLQLVEAALPRKCLRGEWPMHREVVHSRVELEDKLQACMERARHLLVRYGQVRRRAGVGGTMPRVTGPG